MKRSPMPARKKPLRSVNPERRARRRAEEFGPQAELCKTLGCAARHPGIVSGPVVPHHVRTRGAGGKDSCTVPLCSSNPKTGWEGCHERLHRMGARTFEKRYGPFAVRGLPPYDTDDCETLADVAAWIGEVVASRAKRAALRPGACP